MADALKPGPSPLLELRDVSKRFTRPPDLAERIVRLFGSAALLSFLAAYAVYAMWFISGWCFFSQVPHRRAL